MKSKLLLVLVACMLLAGMAAPAMAAQEPVGDRINVLFGEPEEYPADEPFFVLHGWGPVVPSLTNAVGQVGFRLDVAGEDQGKGKLINWGGPDGLGRLWLYNFEDGMAAGEVTFIGHWFLPCQVAVDEGMWSEACPTPNAMVEVLTAEHTVLFN